MDISLSNWRSFLILVTFERMFPWKCILFKKYGRTSRVDSREVTDRWLTLATNWGSISSNFQSLRGHLKMTSPQKWHFFSPTPALDPICHYFLLQPHPRVTAQIVRDLSSDRQTIKHYKTRFGIYIMLLIMNLS